MHAAHQYKPFHLTSEQTFHAESDSLIRDKHTQDLQAEISHLSFQWSFAPFPLFGANLVIWDSFSFCPS